MKLDPQPTSAAVAREDRFSRLRLIGWWDQAKLQKARVLVIGCGALGNELLKNLALLGVRQIVIADLDRVDVTNLSRSILFRPKDVGHPKATVAARSLLQLLPEIEVRPLVVDVMRQLGLGVFTWADLIFAGLDNREARLWVNRSAQKFGKPWIDGAIEGINGVVRVFLPGPDPCYECTLGKVDWEQMQRRLSCNLLSREEQESGKVPTTPTIASIIAGFQVQEGVKLLHGLPVLASKGFVFEGLNHTSYVVQYTGNPECQSHYRLSEIRELPNSSQELSLRELRAIACRDLGADAIVEFSRDLIYELVCPECRDRELMLAPVGSVSYGRGFCPRDNTMRAVETIHSYSGTECFGDHPLSELGLPLYDVFTARSGDREVGYLLAGDAAEVLGEKLCSSSIGEPG